jgi:hypothetical protein
MGVSLVFSRFFAHSDDLSTLLFSIAYRDYSGKNDILWIDEGPKRRSAA